MNVVYNNDFTKSLTALGKRLPETIHDFYGFPEELYEIEYPSPGSPDEARYLIDSVRKVDIKCSSDWGLDHASWAVLKHMYPGANIPVFEMSLDYSFNEWHPKPIQYHYDIASELVILREKGILIIGSGNIVHNLRRIDFQKINGASLAVPTLDHYLPMIYVLALQGENDTLKFTYEGFQHGSISMRCFQIGQ